MKMPPRGAAMLGLSLRVIAVSAGVCRMSATSDRSRWGGSCRSRPPPPMPPTPPAMPLEGEAVILEPRPLKRLPTVLLNAWQQLPSGSWSITLVHGRHMSAHLRSSEDLRPALASGVLRLRGLSGILDAAGMGHTYRANSPIFQGRLWYNQLLLRAGFWASFSAPLLLLFESDTALCPSPTRPLAAFAGYGYVGAPWAAYPGGWFPAWCRNLGSCVGNSGLSLWRRDIMQNVTSQPPSAYEATVARYLLTNRGSAAKPGVGSNKALYRGMGNLTFSAELVSHIDVWASVLLQSLEAVGALPAALAGSAVPSDVVASRFSVETLYYSSAVRAWTP